MGCCGTKYAFEPVEEEHAEAASPPVSPPSIDIEEQLRALQDAQAAIRAHYAKFKIDEDVDDEEEEDSHAHAETTVETKVETKVESKVETKAQDAKEDKIPEDAVPAESAFVIVKSKDIVITESKVKSTSVSENEESEMSAEAKRARKRRTSSRAEEMKKRKEEEEAKLLEIQKEMDRLRATKVKQFSESGTLSKEVEKIKEIDDPEKQRRLKARQALIQEEEEHRQKRREAEQKKIREMEAENAKKREKDKQILEEKIKSGKKLSEYEEKIWKELTSSGPAEVKEEELHASAKTERPEVKKLFDSKIFTDGVKNVMSFLAKAQEAKISLFKGSGASGFRLGDEPGDTELPASIPVGVDEDSLLALIAELKEKREDRKELLWSNARVFATFPEISARKTELMQNLAEAIADHPYLELVEMYASALEDPFLVRLSEKLKDKKMQKVECFHLETNGFSSKAMTQFLDTCSDVECVPKLKEIKLVNQKGGFGADTAAEEAAVNLLKDNPLIVRFTFDFRAHSVLRAEVSRLLARNGGLAKREGRSSLSRTKGAELFRRKKKKDDDEDDDDDEKDGSAGDPDGKTDL